MSWINYYEDLNIPTTWENTSWGNDELPSFVSDKDHNKGYLIWIDSHDLEIRKDHAEFIMGYKNKLMPRFHVYNCYGCDELLFSSDSFDDVIAWIDNNPKTEQQIQDTKEVI